MTAQSEDPSSLSIQSLELKEPLNKYSYFKRWQQENEFSHLITALVDDVRPDVVISANAPLDVQQKLQKLCRQLEVPFVFWLQDVLSIAASSVLKRKLFWLGSMIGYYYSRMEKAQLRKSDLVVLITDDFRSLMKAWNVDQKKLTVIENWAPIDDLPVHMKDNAWSREHGLHDKTCILYAGTLGMKHNPNLILAVAERLRQRDDVVVLVVSDGHGADFLKQAAAERDLPGLRVLGFQPFDRVPEVMGTADVMLAVLEPDAGIFSVPSKVLAYLCARRPLVLAVPTENLAARIVSRNNAGLVGQPEDIDLFVDSVCKLIDDKNLRDTMGKNARNYAEATFDINKIADKMESHLLQLVEKGAQA